MANLENLNIVKTRYMPYTYHCFIYSWFPSSWKQIIEYARIQCKRQLIYHHFKLHLSKGMNCTAKWIDREIISIRWMLHKNLKHSDTYSQKLLHTQIVYKNLVMTKNKGAAWLPNSKTFIHVNVIMMKIQHG